MDMKKLIITFTVLLSSCTSHMVLYKDDIQGYDLGAGEAPQSPACQKLLSEYELGKAILIQKGTRWADPQQANSKHYRCRSGDSSCQNTYARITTISKDQSHLLQQCRRALRNKPNKKAVQKKPTNQVVKVEKVIKKPTEKPQRLDDETTRALAIDNLITRLLGKKVIAVESQQHLFMNFSLFTAMLVQEADITDLIDSVIVGTRYPIKKAEVPIRYPYQVQQVLDDMVILECGRCSLPPIGIRRVNGRPSPIEGQIYNDTRAIYKFVGTHHYRTILNERKQIILFDRITMTELRLPRNHLHEVIPKEML